MADAKTPASAPAVESKATLPARPKDQLIPGVKPDNMVKVQDLNGKVLPNPVPRSWLKRFDKIIKPVPSAKEGK